MDAMPMQRITLALILATAACGSSPALNTDPNPKKEKVAQSEADRYAAMTRPMACSYIALDYPFRVYDQNLFTTSVVPNPDSTDQVAQWEVHGTFDSGEGDQRREFTVDVYLTVDHNGLPWTDFYVNGSQLVYGPCVTTTDSRYAFGVFSLNLADDVLTLVITDWSPEATTRVATFQSEGPNYAAR